MLAGEFTLVGILLLLIFMSGVGKHASEDGLAEGGLLHELGGNVTIKISY